MKVTMRTRFFSLFLNLVMFLTFNLNFHGAYAADTTTEPPQALDCKDTEETGGAYIYQPGCKFNEEKTRAQSWTPKTINKILLGLMAVVAISAAIFNPNKTGTIGCPSNYVAKTGITLRAIIAGGIAYLAGEIQANIRYRDAAKKATDLTFTGRKLEDKIENNKQIEAFDNLIEIYDKQIGAAKTKNALSIIGQVGYTAAAGIEIANIFSCKATCQADHKSMLTTVTGAKTVALLCPSSAAAVGIVQGVEASSIADASADEAETVGNGVKKVSKFKSFIMSVPLVGDIAGAIEKGVKAVVRTVRGAKNETTNTSVASTVTGAMVATATAAAVPATTAVCAPAEGALVALETAALKPVFCCGTDATLRPTYYMDPAGLGNKWDFKEDIYMHPVGTLVDSQGQKAIDEMTSLVVYNAVYEEMSEKILNSDLPKEKKLREIASLGNELDEAFKYLDKNMNGFSLPNEEEVGSRLADSFLQGDIDKISNILSQVSSNVAISNAYAGSAWMDLLGWAGGILVLRMALKALYKNTAAPSPKGRAVFFTLLAAVGGYVLSQDIKTLKSLKGRKKIIEDEKDKFLKAAATDSMIDEGEDGDSTLNLQSGNFIAGTRGLGDYSGCIAATGSTYGPVKCPSLIKREAIRIPKLNDKTRKLVSSAHVSGLNSLQDVAFNAANGSYLDNPNLLAGQMASASSNLKAMRAHNDKLRTKLDELEKKIPTSKDRNGRSVKPLSLASFHKDVMSNFANRAARDFGATDLADSNEESTEEQEPTQVAATKPFEFPTHSGSGAGDFSIDLGLDDEGMDFDAATAEGGEQELENFVLEQNDINKKAEVSIFRILSNRYLLSYPKVLEEKK